MSAHAGPFPTTQSELHDYIVRVWTYLNSAAVLARSIVSTGNMGIFNTLYSHPNPLGVTDPTNLGYIELEALHTDPSTSTTVITGLLHKKIRQHAIGDPIGIENQLRVMYAEMTPSMLNDTDRSIFRLPKRKARGTTHRVATKNTVIWKTTPLGGGDTLTKCWPSGATTLNPSASTQRGGKPKSRRPHKEAGYELRKFWIILKQGVPAPANEKVAGINITIDTKAQMVHHYGNENKGNVLWEFEQWHDPKHPELDGPITGPQDTTL